MTAAVWLAGLAAAQPAFAQDVLLHRQAPNRLGGISGDTAFYDDFGVLRGSIVADRFRLSAANTTHRVVFWAFYGNIDEDLDPVPPTVETIRVRFYVNAGGLPGELRYEEEFLNPPRVYTGFQVFGLPTRKEYRYDVTLSAGFPVAANTDFWLEVSQVGDPFSTFRWEKSNGGEFAVQYPIGIPWNLVTGAGQFSYELWTPEPTTGALGVLAWMIVARRARRRRRGR
ncbi:MAG: hypothetical protein L6Q92_12130 [Phycisphaerae bacterium]|nr:hypothetical protein [Phycisphaerae bacterium]